MSNEQVVDVQEPSKTLQEDGKQNLRHLDTTAATDIISQEGHVPRESVSGRNLDKARVISNSNDFSEAMSFKHRLRYVFESLSKVKSEKPIKHVGPIHDELGYASHTKQMKGAKATEISHAEEVIDAFALNTLDERSDTQFFDDEEIIVNEDVITKPSSRPDLLATGQSTHARAFVDSMSTTKSGDYLDMENYEKRVNYVYRILREMETDKLQRDTSAKSLKTHAVPYHDEYAAYDAIYANKDPSAMFIFPKL